jgi:predicted Zn-dependent protease
MGELPEGWHFILIEGDEPNAYACPGGLIFVSKGLVNLCESEDELAGVLAHEIAHIALDHPIKAISAANMKSALGSLAAYGLGAAAQSQGVKGGDLATLSKSFDRGVGEVGKVVASGYDRDKEAEADKAAVQLLAESGFDPRGLKRILEKLKPGSRSHGDPKKRAASVEQAAFALEPVPSTLAGRTERFKSNAK